MPPKGAWPGAQPAFAELIRVCPPNLSTTEPVLVLPGVTGKRIGLVAISPLDECLKMNETEQALYERISQFAFDEGDEELTFARRLALDNGWTQSYTTRVIEEYKRFVFLARAADHPVTPSDSVDQVWHLHLTYTRSYWERFCGQILGVPLHHTPTRGGAEDARQFKSWYAMTLVSYFRFFGHEPPADIWPDGAIRFGNDTRFQRINTKRHWIVAKPQAMQATRRFVGLVALLLAISTLYVLLLAALDLSDSARNLTAPITSQMSGTIPDASPGNSTAKRANIDFGLLFITVAFGITIALGIMTDGKCPECKRRKALKPSGNIRDRWVPALFGKGGASVTEHEYQCKYCGHGEWRNNDSDGCACA